MSDAALTAAYAGDLSREMAGLCVLAGLLDLAFIFQMAEMEARNVVRSRREAEQRERLKTRAAA